MRGPWLPASTSTWRTPSTGQQTGVSSDTTSRWPRTRKFMIEYAVVLAPLKTGAVTSTSPKELRSSSMSRTRSSISRPSVVRSLRKVARLMSLMVAETPCAVGSVWMTRS